jgi:hypothetical protein
MFKENENPAAQSFLQSSAMAVVLGNTGFSLSLSLITTEGDSERHHHIFS